MTVFIQLHTSIDKLLRRFTPRNDYNQKLPVIASPDF